jgi:hypothetical protein
VTRRRGREGCGVKSRGRLLELVPLLLSSLQLLTEQLHLVVMEQVDRQIFENILQVVAQFYFLGDCQHDIGRHASSAIFATQLCGLESVVTRKLQ